MTTTTAESLIDQSTATGEIVRAPYTPALARELMAACDDHGGASDTVAEYWGVADDEPEWRVHLTGRRDIVVGRVVSVEPDYSESDEGIYRPDALDHYVAVVVTIAGVPVRVGVAVGAPESDHGSVRASGSGVQPYCTAWWVDSSDWASVPKGWVAAVLDELIGASWRLYREASEIASKAVRS